MDTEMSIYDEMITLLAVILHYVGRLLVIWIGHDMLGGQVR